MKKNLSRLFALLLALTLLIGAFPLIATGAGIEGANLLDECTTPVSKNYVLKAIEYYICKNPVLNQATTVFMFEGAAKGHAAYSYGGKRNQAIAVILRAGKIVYVEDDCSTIPDCPDQNYGVSPSAASISDGIYKFESNSYVFNQDYTNKYGNTNGPFAVKTIKGNWNIPCIRLNKSTKQYVSATASDIAIHYRSKDFSVVDTWARSTGCLLVGGGENQTESFADFYNFSGKVREDTSGNWYLVLDRHLAIPELEEFVYGEYNGVVEKLTENSKNAIEFDDVKNTAYYHDAVLWAVENGVTSGTGSNKFSPNQPCKREQIATFIWRAYGSPTPGGSGNPFADVKSGKYYCDPVLWAYYHNPQITSGISETHFGVGETCTRAQVVTFLWNAAGRPEPAANDNPFTDVASTAYYYKSVLWAVENGVTGGTTPTTFSPNDACTRAQVVTFLYKVYGS